MSSRSFWTSKHFLLYILFAIFVAFQSASSKAASDSPQRLKTSSIPTEQLAQIATKTNTVTQLGQENTEAEDEDENGAFSIAVSTIGSEFTDINLYAALIMSFIYSPIFALLSYAISCAISSLIGALYVGKIAFVIPKLVLSYVTAVLFLVFSGFTAYLIYTMKDVELATENSIKKEDQKDQFLNYSQEEQENFLSANAVVARPEAKSGWKKIFSFEEFKRHLFRFFFACILFIVAQLGGDTLRDISDYRSENSFGTVFLGSIIGYAICVALIALIGFLLKELAFRKCKLSLHNTKVVKYIACVLLVLVGCLGVIIDIDANSAA